LSFHCFALRKAKSPAFSFVCLSFNCASDGIVVRAGVTATVGSGLGGEGFFTTTTLRLDDELVADEELLVEERGAAFLRLALAWHAGDFAGELLRPFIFFLCVLGEMHAGVGQGETLRASKFTLGGCRLR